jgi:hypothetical protein
MTEYSIPMKWEEFGSYASFYHRACFVCKYWGPTTTGLNLGILTGLGRTDFKLYTSVILKNMLYGEYSKRRKMY